MIGGIYPCVDCKNPTEYNMWAAATPEGILCGECLTKRINDSGMKIQDVIPIPRTPVVIVSSPTQEGVEDWVRRLLDAHQ